MKREAGVVILVGHGGVPRDFPREKVRRLMMLESQRQASGGEATAEEVSLDREVRDFPRTPANDPYKFGIEKLAAALRARLSQPLLVAYNEFCAPSVQDAAAKAVAEGAVEVVLITSMMTPGGSHSEEEIPQIVRELSAHYTNVSFRYAWPFDMDALAGYMSEHLKAHALA